MSSICLIVCDKQYKLEEFNLLNQSFEWLMFSSYFTLLIFNDSKPNAYMISI